MQTERVFVYGTLRPPRPDTDPDDSRYYPRVAPYIQGVAPARLPGAVIFNLGAYPAARPGEGTIHGDLLTIAPAALEIMDQIEGHPRFFTRQTVKVETPDGSLAAWIYWAPEPLVIGRTAIHGGDWFRRGLGDGIEAAPYTPELLPDPDLVLQLLVRRFSTAPLAWLVSVRTDGRPRARPVRHAWLRGRVYFPKDPSSRQLEDILKNPAVSLAHPDAGNPLVIEGWATPAHALRGRLIPVFREKYTTDSLPGLDASTLVELTPLRLRARGAYGNGEWPGRELFHPSLP